jgi:hypothetical protein
MSVDLKSLAERVRREIDGFAIPPSQPDQFGVPLPAEWFEEGLRQMRDALVDPFWVNPRYCWADSEPPHPVVVVADDAQDNLLAFDPNPDGEFVLVHRRDGELAITNIRGDAIGCFLSR